MNNPDCNFNPKSNIYPIVYPCTLEILISTQAVPHIGTLTRIKEGEGLQVRGDDNIPSRISFGDSCMQAILWLNYLQNSSVKVIPDFK